MGLYRKFNEADLFELMHLIKKKNSGVREVEMATLFASFYGNTIFTIFYNDLIILNRIVDMLEKQEFPNDRADDDAELENVNLKRLYY